MEATNLTTKNTQDLPILNSLSDANTFGDTPTLLKMWVCNWNPAYVYVWGASFEDAFEMLVEWADESCPGALVSHADFRGILADMIRETTPHLALDSDEDTVAAFWKRQALDSEGCQEILEAAEEGLTVIGHTHMETGYYIASDQWGGEEVDPASDEYKAAHARALATHLEDYIQDIVADLEGAKTLCDDRACEHPEDTCYCAVDVRLQVRGNGDWYVHTGDASFDQDHRGFWGGGCVISECTEEDLQELARDLIAQALDQAAQ